MDPRSVRDRVRLRIQSLKTTHPDFNPTLAILQAGSRPDSNAYVRMKRLAAEEVGIGFRHVKLPAETDADSIVRVVNDLSGDKEVSGLLVQLPLGDHITPEDERRIGKATLVGQ